MHILRVGLFAIVRNRRGAIAGVEPFDHVTLSSSCTPAPRACRVEPFGRHSLEPAPLNNQR